MCLGFTNHYNCRISTSSRTKTSMIDCEKNLLSTRTYVSYSRFRVLHWEGPSVSHATMPSILYHPNLQLPHFKLNFLSTSMLSNAASNRTYSWFRIISLHSAHHSVHHGVPLQANFKLHKVHVPIIRHVLIPLH